jgi:DNA primase
MDILQLIQRETGYICHKATAREYFSPCPFCKTGDDRFRLWPAQGRFWCRQCNKSGDLIQFVREYRGLSFMEALSFLRQNHQYVDVIDANRTTGMLERQRRAGGATALPLEAPDTMWAEGAWTFLFDCQAHLMEQNINPKARSWLHDRALQDATLWAAGIGYNPEERYAERKAWGLPPEQRANGKPKGLWLPRGITLPWVLDGELWGINIRRPVGKPKYYWIPGGNQQVMYNAGSLSSAKPAILFEGEFDALVVQQEAGDRATTVATGSTMRARHLKWIARLAATPFVLVAYDRDPAGDEAARFWIEALPNAVRWRPYWGKDATDMAGDHNSIRSWLEAGIKAAQQRMVA